MEVNSSRHFVRGGENTASVRMRRRRRTNISNNGDVVADGSGDRRSNNHHRHSAGDFLHKNRQSGGDWGAYNFDQYHPQHHQHRSYISPEQGGFNQQLQDILNNAGQCSMETLDKKIPPSIRPANNETFSIADAGMARLQQLYISAANRPNNIRDENKSEVITSSNTNHRYHRGKNAVNRRSCDVSLIDFENMVYSAEPGRRDRRLLDSNPEGVVQERTDVLRRPVRSRGARPVSASAVSLKIDEHQQQQHRGRSGGGLASGFLSRVGKSSDAVYKMKRSYPDLREAMSEVAVGHHHMDTATEVSTVISKASHVDSSASLRKGVLWQQRDKMFSRWKERFFILTKDNLQCFKKGSSHITEMGGFIFRIKLSEVDNVELLDKRGYLTIALTMAREASRVLLRKPEGIREWFADLEECVRLCKEKRGMMKSTKEFWSKRQFTDSSSMEQWLLSRQRVSGQATNPRGKHGIRPVPLNSAERQTHDYGFIDAPPAPTQTAPRAGEEPKQDSSGRDSTSGGDLNAKHPDSASNKSQDSGIDSIEKPGRNSSPFREKLPKEVNANVTKPNHPKKLWHHIGQTEPTSAQHHNEPANKSEMIFLNPYSPVMHQGDKANLNKQLRPQITKL